MTEQREGPTSQQTKYLGYLLVRAHTKGVPHLPVEALSRSQVSEWIDYLKTVVGEEGAKSSSSFLPMRPGTDGYRPALDERPLNAIAGHQHVIEPWQTEDGHEIIECDLDRTTGEDGE